MDFCKVDDATLWVYWGAILLNLVLAFYNIRKATSHNKVLQARLRLAGKNNSYQEFWNELYSGGLVDSKATNGQTNSNWTSVKK